MGMAACSQGRDAGGACATEASDALQVSLPVGAQSCPASGEGASCGTGRAAPVPTGLAGVTIAASQTVVGAGRPVTLTATSSVSVEQLGLTLEIFDASANTRLSFCSHGSKCSVDLNEPVGATLSVVAGLGKLSTSLASPDIVATSDPLPITWLSVTLSQTSTYGIGGAAHLEATTNADLTGTRWSVGILDELDHLAGPPCKTGSTCGVDVAVNGRSASHYRAVIGTAQPSPDDDRLGGAPAAATLVDIQAQSSVVVPARLLWGVDSCKALTGDPTGEVYPRAAGQFGAPDFWGRYLTPTMCPGLSASEIATAHNLGMGILAIYDAYDCSAVAGYDTGYRYGVAAADAAALLGIPAGRAIAVDIEPPGPDCPGAANVDPGFIEGWYDSVWAAHYAPAYYGNGTAGSEFAAAWCAAVSTDSGRPEVAANSYLWSFEPSLINAGGKGNAPAFGPNLTGCAGFAVAWQYQLGYDGPNPDVDLDEALSTLPLWYP